MIEAIFISSEPFSAAEAETHLRDFVRDVVILCESDKAQVGATAGHDEVLPLPQTCENTKYDSAPSLNKSMLAIAVASFAVGTVVRVLAAKNDLWFDEVWTLQLLREGVHSFGDVFTNIKHSNNHHLVSLWMWLVGQNASALTYRLPSVVASIGTVALAGLIGARRSWLEGCIAVILTSSSYLLVHYGTEARGYSLAIFFALLAWYALQRFEERRSWIWTIVFWSAVVLVFSRTLNSRFVLRASLPGRCGASPAIARNGDKVCSTYSRFSQCRSYCASLLFRRGSRHGSRRRA